MVKVRFINHASILLEDDLGGASVLTDPWYEGSVFLNGWDLLFPTETDSKCFENVKYIWISHEHPDHFSPTTILNYFNAHPRPKFLFQQTKDRRVVEWLEKNDFEVLELIDGQKVDLEPGLTVFSRSIGTGDAYLVLFIGDQVIVNTNDAIFLRKHLMQLSRDLESVSQIDLLTCQFGLAGKVGGKDLVGDEMRRDASDRVIKLVLEQIHICKPKFFLPSASFKYFCRSDNGYMNQGQATPKSVLSAMHGSSCQPLFLSPGESYDFLGLPPDPNLLIEKFDNAIRTFEITPDHPVEFDLDRCLIKVQEWWNNQRRFHGFLRLFFLSLIPSSRASRSLTICIGSNNEMILLRALNRPQKITKPTKLSIQVSEDVASNAFLNDFGLMSVLISARVDGSEQAIRRLRTFAFLSSRRQSKLPITLKSIVGEVATYLSSLVVQIANKF